MENKEIDKYIYELRQTISVASLHYEVWWVFKDKGVCQEYIKTANQYSLFFKTTIQANFVATVIALYRIYETRTDTYNIKELFKRLKRSRFSTNKLNELEELYRQVKPLWLKIKTLRNEAFGHRNNQLSVSKVFEKARVKPSEFKKLMELTKNILNIVSYEWDQSTHAFNLGSKASTKNLLQDLKKYHELRSNKKREHFKH